MNPQASPERWRHLSTRRLRSYLWFSVFIC
jgi:hypothetical protein